MQASMPLGARCHSRYMRSLAVVSTDGTWKVRESGCLAGVCALLGVHHTRRSWVVVAVKMPAKIVHVAGGPVREEQKAGRRALCSFFVCVYCLSDKYVKYWSSSRLIERLSVTDHHVSAVYSKQSGWSATALQRDCLRPCKHRNHEDLRLKAAIASHLLSFKRSSRAREA